MGLSALRAAVLAAGLLLAAPPQADAASVQAGSGSFIHPFAAGAITVWYHRPARAGEDAPIVFVLHGVGRNAEGYRASWMLLSERGGFVVLAPEFSREEYPDEWRYQHGNRVLRDGTPLPEAQWGFTAIEEIFDAVGRANGFKARTYDIYGHSAGAQFVHRMVLFKPGARYRVAVAANAGWYTLPDFDVPYPYGLAGAGVDRRALEQALGRRLVVLLGDRDTDPGHRTLRRSPEAMRQGAHRFARGGAYFDRARRAAADLKAPLAWSLEVAPGVAHSNPRMAPFAAQWVGARE